MAMAERWRVLALGVILLVLLAGRQILLAGDLVQVKGPKEQLQPVLATPGRDDDNPLAPLPSPAVFPVLAQPAPAAPAPQAPARAPPSPVSTMPARLAAAVGPPATPPAELRTTPLPHPAEAPRAPQRPPTAAELNATGAGGRPFAGLFRCDVGTACPTYSAAFLTTRRQLLGRPVGDWVIDNPAVNMEAASYHTIGRSASAVWTAVDALDFSVEHVSMYERVMGSINMPDSPLKQEALRAFDDHLSALEASTRARCGRPVRRTPTPFTRQTIAVMPFYAAGAGSGHSIRQTKLRYLNITVHSIHCHFDAVVVAVSHPSDRDYVLRESGLDVFDVIYHRNLSKPSAVGVATIREVQHRLKRSPAWARFNFVFYTEADQVLHLRTPSVFAPLLDDHPDTARLNVRGASKKTLQAVVIPHRFHNVPRTEDFTALEGRYNGTEAFRRLHAGEDLRQLLKQGVPGADRNLAAFFTPNVADPSVRREMHTYQTMRHTRFRDDLDGNCCFAYKGQSQPDYSFHGQIKSRVQDGRTEMFSIGEGLSMVAGDCCFICVWTNRYCHHTCLPRTSNAHEHCGEGAFSERWS